MIQTRNLSKSQGSRRVADGLDLHVTPGETVAILGASGSGKTTLLRMLAGLELPDSGQIFIGGRPVNHRNAPHTRGIGFLFQHSALWPHMRVAENVMFSIESVPRDWREQRTRHLLQRTGMADLAERLPATLSGGEARRVALARALAAQNPILLLDEPTSNLDSGLRDQMHDLIADERAANGLTVLLATHDHCDAARLADRCLVLSEGRLWATELP